MNSMWKLGLVTSIGLLASADVLIAADIPTIASDMGPWAQLGAVGILAGVCWRLFGTIDRMSDKWDTWEQQRHVDHEQLNQTLMDMRANCSAVNAVVATSLDKLGKEVRDK